MKSAQYIVPISINQPTDTYPQEGLRISTMFDRAIGTVKVIYGPISQSTGIIYQISTQDCQLQESGQIGTVFYKISNAIEYNWFHGYHKCQISIKN